MMDGPCPACRPGASQLERHTPGKPQLPTSLPPNTLESIATRKTSRMKTIGHAIGVAAKQVSSAALRQRPAAAAAVASTPTAPNGSVTPWAARCISSSMARQSNPSDNRRGSEGTMAGAGSVSSILNTIFVAQTERRGAGEGEGRQS